MKFVLFMIIVFAAHFSFAYSPIPTLNPSKVTGTKRILVLRINFSDQTADPQSKASLQTQMQLMKQFYRSTTFNAMDIDYEITENLLTMPKLAVRGNNPACVPQASMSSCAYTLNLPECKAPNSPNSQGCKNHAASQPACMAEIVNACPYYLAQGEYGTYGYLEGLKSIGRDAYVVAAAAGGQYNPQNFDYVYFRYNNPAPIDSFANVDGSNKNIWMKHSDYRTFAHELGHMIGFWNHADSWYTTDSTPFGNGSINPYGDPIDVMGSGSGHRSHFNAYHKVRSGWISQQNRISVLELNSNSPPSSRIITISAHDTGSHAHAPYAIRLIHSSLDSSQFDYWISFRQLINTPFHQNGVEIHRGYRDGSQSVMIDTNPQTVGDLSDAPLAIGQTISIPGTNISITPLRKNGTVPETVDIRIDYLNPSSYEIINWGGVTNDKPLVGHFYDSLSEDAVIYREGPISHFWIKQTNGAGIMDVTWGQTGDEPQVGQFLSGFRSQVAVFRPANGTWYILDPINGTIVQQPWGQTGDVSLVGNFLDERVGGSVTDDKFEIAVFRASNNSIYIRNPRTGLMKVIGWGQQGDQPLVGDFLGRGYDQIAQYRSSNNTWYIRDARTDEQIAMQFGTSGDLPVVGKFFSGTCTQIGVYRPSTQTFFARDTVSNCGVRIRSIAVGSAGDIPLAININGGIGTFQRPALYRPSTGQWNIFKAFE